MNTDRVLPDWPRALGGAVADGQIRSVNSEFQVTECLGFDLTGSGEHDYLLIRKDGANTQWVADRLAQHAAVRAIDVGFSGLKDRHAVTTQWFSVPAAGGKSTDWQSFQCEGITILEQQRHDRKLRRGAHRSNRFLLCLRAEGLDRDQVAERLGQIRQSGVPNYFGEQRFGLAGSNLAIAERLFAGERMKKRAKGLALSAARSWLFNEMVAARVSNGSWNTLLPGDCASLAGSASFFQVPEPDEALLGRCREFDIHPSAALWGRGPLASGDAVAQLEQDICHRHSQFAEGLEKHGLSQARRATRLVAEGLQWEFAANGVWLTFSLESGAFATAVLRELAAYTDVSANRQRPRKRT